MGFSIGIDIGAVSATAAVVQQGEPSRKELPGFRLLRELPDARGRLYVSAYRRTRGRPVATAEALLGELVETVGVDGIDGVCLTGNASNLVAEAMSAATVNEFKAIAAGLSAMGVDVRTVFEMGGESSKYLRLTRNADGSYAIVDYSTNGDCAAGTGSFIDQQAGRLKYNVEDIGTLCLEAERAAQVAGRCSVFAKSDMIHAQQKGYNPAEVLRGLCNAVARNFRTAVVRSHPVEAPVAFIGGVAANEAVVRAMQEAFGLDDSQLVIPEMYTHVSAVGAAMEASRAHGRIDFTQIHTHQAAAPAGGADEFPRQAPLSLANVTLLRDHAKPAPLPADGSRANGYLGVDIGSVSTNVVVVDDQARLLAEIYTRTMGRPIEVVTQALKDIEERLGDRVIIRGTGTTGSGRELIGELIGADTINDEITCHKTGATFVGQQMLGGRTPDTIFEIGGQDSKYISLEDGVVVDFTMNEACAAGTGSFLEERAEELDIAIKGQFAELALSSTAPIRLGERCTVFMERDVNSYLTRGAKVNDLVAGLAYSVVYNYINRVVRGRKIGETVFFQGGTAYNDAVAAAFAAVTGKEIIIPPHNGVVGAIGAALLAKEKMQAIAGGQAAGELHEGGTVGQYITELTEQTESASRFRGYDVSKVDFTLREFTCKACSNTCQIQEFTVEGQKTYWGDKCSDRFRKQTKSALQPVIPDLMAWREELLLDESDLPTVAEDAPTVGIPMTMFAYESLPFWRTLLTGIGCRTILSDPTNKQIIQAGLETVVAEPCFPIIVAHGHLVNLAAKNPDWVLLPNVLSMKSDYMHTESHLCPWHQTLPFVCRQAPGLKELAKRFITPVVFFREGEKFVTRKMQEFLLHHPLQRQLGLTKRRIAQAMQAAFAAQSRFRSRILERGREALQTLQQSGQIGIVLVGRPYNIHDAGVNLSVGAKLRDTYGCNVLPVDFLPGDDENILDVNENMFWNLGHRIMGGAKIVGRHPNLHIIYVTNFKCGPDSFIKHFVSRCSGKPFLSLQFDGHSNDAGMMTRCEAYLDSKGVLRPWKPQQPALAAAAE